MKRAFDIRRMMVLAGVCFAMVWMGEGHAATRNWGGSFGGDWFTAGNWTETAVPADGDDVLVSSGSILLTNATDSLSSFVITNATLTFTNWTTSLSATNVTIRNGGTIYHAASKTNAAPSNTNRVWIIASNVTINAGGGIHTSERGYAGGRYNYTPPIGEGPGGGRSVSDRGGGGGHGGKGGNSNKGTVGGSAYGSVTAPTTLGSGGGGGNSFGKAGGGAVRIDASGTVRVDGSILANGGKGNDQYGSGAGGSIYITCHTIAGAGTLSAAGLSPNSNSGGGGGGRIAIDYNPAAQAAAGPATATMTVAGGTASPGESGVAGTLHLTDTSILNATNLRVTGVITFGSGSSWSVDHLTVPSASPVFPSGFAIDVTNDFVVTGSGLTTLMYSPTLSVGGHLILTNGGDLTLYSPTTNGQAYGTLVGVTGDVSIASGSVLALHSHPTNGGSIKMVVNSLLVASGGIVDADGKGYKGSKWSVTAHKSGYGPGGGGSTSARGGGGGHGGAGGNGNQAGSTGGPTYGSSNAPVQCGSGAGGGNAYGGNGGGLIWVFAEDAIHVDGTLDADGSRTGGGDQDGGGSGGGIYLKTTTFSGSGQVVARGAGDGAGNSGGGGGGRIAIVDWTSDTFAGLVSADPGKFYTWGGTGTIVRTINQTLKSLTVAGTPTTHGSPTPWPYGLNGVTVGMVITNDIQRTDNVTATTRDLFLSYSLTNAAGTDIDSGTATQTVFTVTDDLYLTYVWTNQFYLVTTAGPNGGLQADRTGWYHDSTQLTVTATAAVNHAFSSWSGPGVPVGASTNNPLTLTMDQARTVQANFVSTVPMPRTWNGVGTWLSSTNWTPPGIPGPADDLTVNSGELTIGDPSVAASMTVADGGTVLFTNWNSTLTVGAFTVESNGVVTHAVSDLGAAPGISNRIHVVCSSFTVEAGGLIDVNARGYAGGPRAADGYGPGGGKVASDSGGGGGYGGRGGRGNTSHGVNSGGSPYGSAAAPTQPGSGGAGAAGGAVNDRGGAGGGLVWIEASDAATADGTIRANGAAGTGSTRYGGGGSGGGIYIACNTFRGDGALQAVGGEKTYQNGGGGGGRIAIEFDRAAQAALGTQPTATFSVRHATTYQTDDLDDGTVYLTDETFLPSGGTIFPDRTHVYGITNWSVSDMTVDTAPLFFMEEGFGFSAANDLTVTGNGGLRFDIAHQTFFVGGNLTLTNGGDLTLVSGPTNAAGVWTNCGAVVDIDGTVTITGLGSTLAPLSHGTNGGSIRFTLEDIVIAASAEIDTDGGGFEGRYDAYGYGPGSGKGGNNSGGGGGYGGRGGDGNHFSYSEGGPTYGSTNMPLMPGSPGGGIASKGYRGGNGGGLVWIEARTVTLNNGTITATGNNSAAGNGGAGSGGGIYIHCFELDGTMGSFDASGANCTTEGGGGGGGRIAIWRYRHNIAATNCLATAGTGRISGGAGSDPGSVVWGEWSPPRAMVISIR